MTQKQIGKEVSGTDVMFAGHISRELFCDWQEGRLKEEEEAGFLGHIGGCTFCAERFGEWMEEGLLMEGSLSMEEGAQGLEASGRSGCASCMAEPPRYLKEEILSKVHRMDVKAARKLKESSRQVQLMLYSLKVGIAVVASIFLLTVMADIQNVGLELKESQRMEQKLERQMDGKGQVGREREEGIADSLRRGSREITNMLKELSNGWFRIEIGTDGAADGDWD